MFAASLSTLTVLLWSGLAEPRCRDLGIVPGVLPTGPLNAITDVGDVRVGHFTLRDGTAVNTGATAIIPHGGNVFAEKVPAAIVVGNGFGKLMGLSQVMELGEIETPIVLTNTLSVPRAADAVIEWTLNLTGNEGVRSVNPVVGETNDGLLNDIRRRALMPAHVLSAITSAATGSVAEGTVGAGTGTVCFGWKGGIGTSSRRAGEYTVGVLVQSNFGGNLEILGVPVWKELRTESFAMEDGSIIIVVATDAPLSDRNLERLGKRALLAIGRTGGWMSNGSGDYVIAFSTADSVRRSAVRRSPADELPNDRVTPLFQAVVEATEEAIYNSLFAATRVDGHRGSIERLPAPQVVEILKRSGRINTVHR